MTTSWPLRVRVALALGWGPDVEVHPPLNSMADPASRYFAYRPDEPAVIGYRTEIPRYDTDWAAIGPFIEKHGVELRHCWPGDHGADGFHWVAFRSGDVRSPDPAVYDIEAEGDTPQLAVCYLVLALKLAGKL